MPETGWIPLPPIARGIALLVGTHSSGKMFGQSQWAFTTSLASISQEERERTMIDNNAAIAIYKTHADAEAAISELKKSKFDIKRVSIVGKDRQSEEHVVGYYNTGDRMKYWGEMGAFWGGLWGFLFGAAFFAIPGIGPVVIAGPLVGWIVGALEGSVVIGGLSVIGAALYGIGIPKDSILKYESAIKADRFLLVVHGTGAEVAQALDILRHTGALETALHQSEETLAKLAIR
jgi:uncharacterized membrane protein